MATAVEIYDTTLRDGSQGEGVSFSVEDKLHITRALDELGVHYVEGGWPGSNPKDMEYFDRVRALKLGNTRVAAFGSTRHAKNTPGRDPNLRQLVKARTPVITLFGKAWDLHVRDALRVPLETNLEMIASSLKYLRKKVETLIYDAEHFFDGYNANPAYAMKTLEAALEAGAETLVLCDTNGGNLPSRIAEVTTAVREHLGDVALGIHAHNDSGLAVANSVEAVRQGATHVQGTMNGLGERTGNADLTAVIPNVELKLGRKTLGRKALRRLTETSRYIYETANLPLRDNQPFVGRSAFAHKGGIHVSAVSRNAATYEHVRPETVGNERRILVSELSGRSNILARSRVDLKDRPEKMKAVLERLMTLENEGYAFENADASFELLVRKVLGDHEPRFHVESFRVISETRGADEDEASDEERMSEATVKVRVDDTLHHTVAEGDHGPVNALDNALRKALVPVYPVLAEMHLADYRVHVVNAQAGTEARVRVWIESMDAKDIWGTVGVSANIIEASMQALCDSVEYKLLKGGTGRKSPARKGAKKASAKKKAAKKAKGKRA